MKNMYELFDTYGVMFVERKGKLHEVLFSLEDFEKISNFNGTWHIDNRGYVKRVIRNKTTFLHRLVKPSPEGMVIDHINRNKLDNRQGNLRIVTNAQNMQNVNSNKRSKTGIRGVSKDNRFEKTHWRARLTVNKKEIYLGTYDTLAEAEKAVIDGRKKYMPYSYEEIENKEAK